MVSKATNLLAVAVTVAGLLLGPGYLAYCWYFSGSSVGTQKKLRTAHPLTLSLSPEMNPVRFLVVATFSFDSRTIRNETYGYHAVLARDTETIWEERFSVHQAKKTHNTTDKGFKIGISPKSVEVTSPLRTFSVDRAGEFTLTVRPE